MLSLEEKKDLILDNERHFAYLLAHQILKLPKLNLWMILIPIIIIFHMFKQQKIVRGRGEFAENYMISRKRALEEALAAVEKNTDPNLDEILSITDLPKETLPHFTRWMKALVENYMDLLRAEGESYEDLIRGVYKSNSGFLLYLNRLNQLEKEFHNVLRKHIIEKTPDAADIIDAMGLHSETLRRQHAEDIFS